MSVSEKSAIFKKLLKVSHFLLHKKEATAGNCGKVKVEASRAGKLVAKREFGRTVLRKATEVKFYKRLAAIPQQRSTSTRE